MRRLSAEEAALWRRVVESVTPLHGPLPAAAVAPIVETGDTYFSKKKYVSPKQAPAPEPSRKPGLGTTLDAGWDRRLARGLVQPDRSLDLHGHNLATAYDLLGRRLGEAVAEGARLLLLITGKPRDAKSGRGAIRAAVGDWLAASPYAGDIAAVRGAHPRHGGAGALYIVLRRRR
ncbi:MAG TPA: Smr/MutS family protein [Allosphingosinicella sp.]|nr:Smr/MutS family protein [Allosphingosinicella sp.]